MLCYGWYDVVRKIRVLIRYKVVVEKAEVSRIRGRKRFKTCLVTGQEAKRTEPRSRDWDWDGKVV